MRRHFKIAIMILRVALLFSGIALLASSLAAAATPTPQCSLMLKAAFESQSPEIVPVGCWKIGPISLGMMEKEVEHLVGQPVARSVNTPETEILYAFPQVPGSLITKGRARFRMAVLRFVDGRLIAIDNDPPSQASITRCSHTRRMQPPDRVELAADAGPLLDFDGVEVGDSLKALHRHFGLAPSNRSRDWYTYQPVPVIFDVYKDRIAGFEIAINENDLQSRPMPRLNIRRNFRTCRLLGIDFAF